MTAYSADSGVFFLRGFRAGFSGAPSAESAAFLAGAFLGASSLAAFLDAAGLAGAFLCGFFGVLGGA